MTLWAEAERSGHGSYLIHRHRGSGIALYAADAFTLFVVTAEHFRDDVGGNQNAGDVKNWGNFIHFFFVISMIRYNGITTFITSPLDGCEAVLLEIGITA